MDGKYDEIMLIAGSSNRPLAENIAKELNVGLANARTKKFSDGETYFELDDSVRGEDVFVIQSTNSPTNENLMELLIMIDSLKRASAGRITVVNPYYGYSRQDRKTRARDPITAKLVADLITTAGADRIVSMDLHAPQIQGFFDIPFEVCSGSTMIANYFLNQDLDDVVVVAPDEGSVKRSTKIAKGLQAPLAIIFKSRPNPNEVIIQDVIGDVEGKNCIMVDDMIDTGGTILKGAQALLDKGAKSVRVACTHGIFSGDAIKKLDESPIEEVVCLDTINIPEEKLTPKFTVLPSHTLFADTIKNIHQGESLTENLAEGTYI